MRRSLPVFLAVILGCTAPQELATTTTTRSVTTSTAPATTTVAETTTAPSTTSTTTLPVLQGLVYEEVARLSFPVQMTALAGAEYSYIATKDGRVWAYDGSSVLDDPVLDISQNVLNRGERGLLSIVIHPDDATRFLAHYTATDGDTVVSEFTMVSSLEIDPVTETTLLRHEQPAANHNGGMLQFGPDGGLYLGLGDGGGSNDRFGNGQNRETLLGGLVRIDVDDPEIEPELFQYGLRNPWRFWIDGDLIYIADVGQNAFEEVSVAPLTPDVNYGWPITEGLHCFQPSSGCDTTGITLPVIEVSHGDAGTCSMTGGIIYRGPAIPEIEGQFFYSDYCGGYLRSFAYLEGAVAEEMDWTPQVGEAGSVTGFGIDSQGEMYVATTEVLYKVVAQRG